MQASNSNKNYTSEEQMKNIDSGRKASGGDDVNSSSSVSRIEEHKLAVSEGTGVEEEEEDKYEKMMIAITGKSSRERTTKDKAVKFPLKLMYVLICGDYDHFVHWKTNQIDGSDIFVINDINAFTIEVLPSLFKVAKYESFQRKLYRWGFLKTQRSRSEKKMKRSISYSHPHFKKGDFALAGQMTCSGPQAKEEKSVLKYRKRLQRKITQMKPPSVKVPDSLQTAACESTSEEMRLSVAGDLVAFPPHALQTETTDNKDPEDVTLSIYSPEYGPMSLQVSSILNQQAPRGADRRNQSHQVQTEMDFSGVGNRTNCISSYHTHANTSLLGQLNSIHDVNSNFSSLGSAFAGHNPRIETRRASVVSATSHDSSSFFEEANFPPAVISNFRRDSIDHRSHEDQILGNAYAALLKGRYDGKSRNSI